MLFCHANVERDRQKNGYQRYGTDDLKWQADNRITFDRFIYKTSPFSKLHMKARLITYPEGGSKFVSSKMFVAEQQSIKKMFASMSVPYPL